MERIEHLQKAHAALGQTIEHLKRTGIAECEVDMARKLEVFVLDLIEEETPAERPEPVYVPRDYDPYEEGGTLA